MKNPTITNRNTGVSWKYSGPFAEGNTLKQEIFVLDFYGKVVNVFKNGHGYFTSTENTQYEVTFDPEPISEALEAWLDYDYNEIKYLFDKVISDAHKMLNRNIEWEDGRAQYSLKLLKKNIDKVREKVKVRAQLTRVEQQIYDCVLEQYRRKIPTAPSKNLPTRAIEIIYGTTINNI